MNNQTIRQKWEIMKGPTKNPESKNIVIETKMTTNSLQIDHTQLKRRVGSKLGRQVQLNSYGPGTGLGVGNILMIKI